MTNFFGKSTLNDKNSKSIEHFTNYNLFFQEIRLYSMNNTYRVVRSGDVVIVTFRDNNEFVICLNYIKN